MDELRSLLNSNTKALILNTPNNPLGKAFSREELMVGYYAFVLSVL
jgi:aspartate/methionine/tyrosine aminotransferase